MMKLHWLPSAELALEEIVDYIAIDNLDAALALGDRIISAVDRNLPEHPNMGRPGRVEGTRELVVHQNYIVCCSMTFESGRSKLKHNQGPTDVSEVLFHIKNTHYK